MVHHRHTQKRVEGIFPGFRQVVESGMRESIFQVNRFFTHADLANQPFRQSQADIAHGFLFQALRGHQHIALVIFVAQVNGTDLGAHGIAHALRHQIQRGTNVRRIIHFLNNTTQGVKHQRPLRVSPSGYAVASLSCPTATQPLFSGPAPTHATRGHTPRA